MASQVAVSRYRGFRVTVTQDPARDTAWVTVATKQVRGRWDEWTLVFPALEITLGTPSGMAEVLDAVQQAFERVRPEL